MELDPLPQRARTSPDKNRRHSPLGTVREFLNGSGNAPEENNCGGKPPP